MKNVSYIDYCTALVNSIITDNSKLDRPSKQIKKDAETVRAMLAKLQNGEALTMADRFQLVHTVNCAFHENGKIEDISSIDSSCSGCEFCNLMRKAAERDATMICGSCYDAAQETYRFYARFRHQLNMVILSTVLFTVEELSTVPATAITRINSSGDTPNTTYARNAIRFALAHSYSKVAIWGKNVPAIEKAFDLEGKPSNMAFIQSSIHINKTDKPSRYADSVFTVYLTEEDVQRAIAAGAWECNGRKCKDCGFHCYDRENAASYASIAELYRGSKAQKKAIADALAKLEK
jgi:gluconate kinase